MEPNSGRSSPGIALASCQALKAEPSPVLSYRSHHFSSTTENNSLYSESLFFLFICSSTFPTCNPTTIDIVDDRKPMTRCLAMNKNLKKLRSTANLLSALYLIFLSIVLLAPVPKSSDSIIVPKVISFLLDFDFYTHLVIFLIWGFLASSWPYTALKTSLIAATLAALLELLQGITFTRTSELTDLIANVTGTLTGLYIGNLSIFTLKPTDNGLPSSTRSS